MASIAVRFILAVVLLWAAPACGEEDTGKAANAVGGESSKPSELTVESIRSICEEIRRWVRGVGLDASGKEVVEDERGRIRRYDWDDPKKLVRTFTRKELCRTMVRRYNQTRDGGCEVTLKECLAALEKPSTYDASGFRFWKGLHSDTNREQKHPDDAFWFEPVRWERTPWWRQDVVWCGENPRRGWHCADAEGLWGWDPKLTGHPERGPGVLPLDRDGQRGWKGAHAGYPFDCPDGCRKYILWILPKEVYLESMDTKGRRIAVGLWDQYAWALNPDGLPPECTGEEGPQAAH